MLDRGVYLPPSAYEAWFLSAAHDDRAVQTVLDALPARRPRGRRRPGGPPPMSQTPDTIVHLLRHGEVHNPEGVLYGRRDGFHLSDLGRQMAERSRRPSPTATSPTCGPRRWSGPRRPRAPLADGARSRDRHRRPGHRVDQHLRGQAVRRRRQRAAQARRPGGTSGTRSKPSWGEPYKEIVARMMAAVARRPRRGRGPRGRDRLPPAADLDHPPARREALVPARPAQAPVHAVLADVASLRRRPLTQVSYTEPAGDLIPVKDRRRAVLGRRRARGEQARLMSRSLAVLPARRPRSR